jgi:glycosyltransferase involved in cell wall biosynthesis
MSNILFVLDRDFASNSSVHVSALANELCLLGLDCVVAVPRDKHLVSECGDVLYRVIEYREADQLPALYANGLGPQVVHCWTPREIVRKFSVQLRTCYDFKLFVHLEDNEELLFEHLHDVYTTEETRDLLSHPVYYREFLQQAQGVTVIIEPLKEFVPAGVPHLTLWPGVDPHVFYPRPTNDWLRAQFELPPDSTVIVYPGNVHQANAAEVASLYLAVALLNRANQPTYLIRTGKDYCDFLVADGDWIKPFLRELGYVPRVLMPEVLALADIFIQPGRPDPFNEYRFPSKLPEFLALGKPLILPANNLGEHLVHEKHALVLEVADGVQIAEAVGRLCREPALADQLAVNGLAFARTFLSWPRQAARLLEFYQSIA